jgi:hypothetical protein
MSSISKLVLTSLVTMSVAACCLTPVAEGRDAGVASGVCTPPCDGAAGLTCVGSKCVCASSALSPCRTPSGGTVCTDLQVDPNCGACGHQCDGESGFLCIDGACKCGVSGYGFCPDARGTRTCRNLQNDPNNCGTCAHVCPGSNCVAGACR